MRLALCTVVWGPMLDWFKRYCAPSVLAGRDLLWADRDFVWHVYTNEPRSLPPHQQFTLHELPRDRRQVNDCIKDLLENCIMTGQHVMVLPPDLVFAQYSLQTIKRYSEHYDLVAFSFPRCRTSVLQPIPGAWHNHRRMVDLALQHLHPESRPPAIKMRQLSHGEILVRHHCPIVSFRVDDRSRAIINSLTWNNGQLDHVAPVLMIEAGMTYQVIQHSDECFAVEPTDRSSAFLPTLTRSYQKLTGQVMRKANAFWSQFEATWRRF